LIIDFTKPVPLFPLNACVLLPNATAPLHIFEDRYRRMTRDVLDTNGLIAMAMFDGDQWRSTYEGSPPVLPCVCIGYVARHDRLEDGRYNILLQGLCRARITQEIDSLSYRTAILEPFESDPAMEIDLEPCREQIESLFDDPLLQQWAQIAAVRNLLSREIPTAAMLDLAAMALCRGAKDRYELLAEPCPCKRAEWLRRMLVRTRQTLDRARLQGACLSEDGVALN
jgi:Lon protease-like protein